MPSAYEQFRWRCIQRIVAGLAIALAGFALTLGDVGFGSLVIPKSIWGGVVIAVAGVLFSLAAVVALRKRPRPTVRT